MRLPWFPLWRDRLKTSKKWKALARDRVARCLYIDLMVAADNDPTSPNCGMVYESLRGTEPIPFDSARSLASHVDMDHRQFIRALERLRKAGLLQVGPGWLVEITKFRSNVSTLSEHKHVVQNGPAVVHGGPAVVHGGPAVVHGGPAFTTIPAETPPLERGETRTHTETTNQTTTSSEPPERVRVEETSNTADKTTTPLLALMARWNEIRVQRGFGRESLTRTHRIGCEALLAAADGELAMAEEAIAAFHDDRDPELADRHWPVGYLPARAGGLIKVVRRRREGGQPLNRYEAEQRINDRAERKLQEELAADRARRAASNGAVS